jgi:cyclopropane-fatty-acyl-phospholipid synthase
VTVATSPGASAQAIQAHYDVGNAFYALWLDETMTYSAARWEPGDDPRDLALAQRRKVEWHLASARARQARRLLDIGCGWGATLAAAAELPRLDRAVGLTLSEAQANHVRALGIDKVEVRLEPWAEHAPAEPYDSIISIGAFEHFTKPADDAAAKIAIYRDFFDKCRGWLDGDGAMSLQTIAYGTLRRDDPNVAMMSEIFPDSDLPRLEEIVVACDGLFEIVLVRNDRHDYARTCELWAGRLKAERARAVDLVGRDQVARYERYLRLSAAGFRSGRLNLFRLTLRPIG